MAPLSPACPAVANVIEGATPERGGIVCGVLKQDDELRDHLLTGSALDPFYELRTDPSIVLNSCCGDALPVLTPGDDNRHAHYTNCLVWQTHIERERLARERGLGLDGREPVGAQRAALADTFGTTDYAEADRRAELMERGVRLPMARQEQVTAADVAQLTDDFAGWSAD